MVGEFPRTVSYNKLRKRFVIETVNDELKNMCQMEHFRHRSTGNFLKNLVGELIGHSFFKKKPNIKML